MAELALLKENLLKQGYKVTMCATCAEAADYLVNTVKGTTVGFGGSTSIKDLNLYERLSENNEVFWHWMTPGFEAQMDTRLKANASKVYISSVNAISEKGEIINIDGCGNRLAAIEFGPKKVYLLIGKNKLADDLESAIWRARNIAAPLNAVRLHTKTPCAVKGDKCYDCNSPQRICKVMSVILQKPVNMIDYEVILIDEKLGF